MLKGSKKERDYTSEEAICDINRYINEEGVEEGEDDVAELYDKEDFDGEEARFFGCWSSVDDDTKICYQSTIVEKVEEG